MASRSRHILVIIWFSFVVECVRKHVHMWSSRHHRQLSSFGALRVSINTGALKYTFSEAAILIAVVVIVNVICNIMRNEGGGWRPGGLCTKIFQYLSKWFSHFCFKVVCKKGGRVIWELMVYMSFEVQFNPIPQENTLTVGTCKLLLFSPWSYR